MNWFYRHLIRPVLFAQDAEHIHAFTMHMLGLGSRSSLAVSATESFFGSPELPITVFGLRFPNPVGLAAGMDKTGEAVPIWPAMGFGHSELGAITFQPQPGNPAPRIFRIIPDEAIINRMGFNNEGAQAMAERLTHWRSAGLWPKHPVGINLGKNKVTPLEKAPQDYANVLRILWPHADFFVVNVSSPNTPNLRQLQDKAALSDILNALAETQNGILKNPENQNPPHLPKPILVKVAPDLTFEALDEILALAKSHQVAGIVATNTTITRPTTTDTERASIYAETGGLSGKPLRARSTEIIRHIYKQSRGALPIIGVGGIFTAEDAWEKIAAGASLVQIYTGMIYQGPGAARAIVTGLQEILGAHGFKEISQAVGCENPLQ
jgi:dihydroorotate dehydrogenase